MNLMKFVKLTYITPLLFNNKEKSGMTISSRKRSFKQGDWAFCMTPDSDFKGKICTHWLGPYNIDIVYDNGSVKLCTINE
jgi:hypothetical protein